MLYRRTSALILAGLALLLLAGVAAAAPDSGVQKNTVALSGAGAFPDNPYNFQHAPVLQATDVPNQPPAGDGTSTSQPVVNKSIGNDTCLACHSQPNLSMQLENGQVQNLFISPEVYNDSIHGQQGYACVQCHTAVGDYPHPPFSATDSRDVSLQLVTTCKRCHLSQFELTQDSVHAAALAAGNRNAALCTDCHTAHAVRQLTDPATHDLLPETRVWIPQTCAQCHYAIYQKYSTSVHGSALLGEGNPDVPTCIDCHGVHNIENPETATFRLKSPDICAKCHTDPMIMDKYGVPTQVLNTYVADFHGTTITIFRKETPDSPNNKPVCYDCHGVHDIKSVDDPQVGLRIRENLLARCQVCHPEAAINFPDAWLSHYIPSPEKTPLVYFVNLFYKFFIPSVLGGMAVLVALDITIQFRKRVLGYRPGRKVRRRAKTPSSTVSQPAPADPAESAGTPAKEQDTEGPDTIAGSSEASPSGVPAQRDGKGGQEESTVTPSSVDTGDQPEDREKNATPPDAARPESPEPNPDQEAPNG